MLSVMYQSLTHYNYIVLVSLNDSREQNAILAVWSHDKIEAQTFLGERSWPGRWQIEGVRASTKEQRDPTLGNSGNTDFVGFPERRGALERQRRPRTVVKCLGIRSVMSQDAYGWRWSVMNRFVVCLKSSELALFVGPLIVLFLFEVALVLAFIRQVRQEGLFPVRTVSRRREESTVFEVSDV